LTSKTKDLVTRSALGRPHTFNNSWAILSQLLSWNSWYHPSTDQLPCQSWWLYV